MPASYAELVHQQLRLRRPAGAADDAVGAEQPGELAGRAAHGAGGRRDEHGVALLQRACAHEPDVRREAGLPEDAQPVRQRSEPGVDGRGCGGVDHRVVTPAQPVPT